MKLFLFLVLLFFSLPVFCQTIEQEESSKSKKRESNSLNSPPQISNEEEEKISHPEKVPSRMSYYGAQGAVIENASIKIERILREINTMNSRKTPTSKQQQLLNYELSRIENANQNSFEYHLYRYKIGNYDFSRIDNLKEAERIKPNHPEVLKSLSAYNFIVGNDKELKGSLSKMNAGKHFSTNLTSFAADVLLSLPKNAVLITHGEDDTFPLLMEQFLHNTRKDVKIINLNFLQSDTYREALRKNGLMIPDTELIDNTFFKSLIEGNNDKNLVIATTVPKNYLSTLNRNLFVKGLSFSYAVDNDASNQKEQIHTYENFIEPRLKKKISSESNNALLSNYLPLLFTVRNYWIEKGNIEKQVEIESMILEIGKLTGNTDRLQKLMR